MKKVVLLLILLFPFALIGQKVLKAGTYQSLKPTESIVLDTGNFTFIGLEMSALSPLRGFGGLEFIMIDARVARSIEMIDCQIAGNGTETGLRIGEGKATITNGLFDNLAIAIWAEGKGKLTLNQSLLIDFQCAGIFSCHADIALKDCYLGFRKEYKPLKKAMSQMPKEMKEEGHYPYGIYCKNGDLGSLTLTGNNVFSGPFVPSALFPINNRFNSFRGNAIRLGKTKAVIADATFEKWKYGIRFRDVAPNSFIPKIKASVFHANARAIELETPTGTSMNLDFSCNELDHKLLRDGTANPKTYWTFTSNSGQFQSPIGINVLPGGELANVGKFNPNLTTAPFYEPGANVFPVTNGTVRNQLPTSGDVETGWSSPTGWTSIYNSGSSAIQHFRWKNEFFGSFFPLTGIAKPEVTIDNKKVIPSSIAISNAALEAHSECSNTDIETYFPLARVAVVSGTEKSTIASRSILGQSIPNPAGLGKVEIPYSIAESFQQAEIQVFELATGRFILKIGVKESRGNVSMETTEMKSGIYGYRLLVDGKQIDNKKMVVLK